MIIRNPLPPKRDWRWIFIWSRQIGEYRVRFEWLKYKYIDKGGLDYVVEWRDRDDQVLHTEFGQRTPEW